MSEQEKWEEEAQKLAEKYYMNSNAQNAFVYGYLAACRKRQEEKDKEIERLKEEIKRLGYWVKYYEANQGRQEKPIGDGKCKGCGLFMSHKVDGEEAK